MLAVYFNQSIFDDAKMDYPEKDAKWTWADLQDIAQKLTTKKSGEQIYGFGTSLGARGTDAAGNMWELIGILKANGGRVLTPDGTKSAIASQANAEALTYFVDMYQGGVIPKLGSYPIGTNPAYGGNVAMWLDGSWATSAERSKIGKKFVFDVAPMPVGSTGKRGVSGAGGAWSMAATSKVQDAAWKFMEFIAGEHAENELNAKRGRSIPGNTKSYELWLKTLAKGGKPPANVEVFPNEAKDAFTVPASPILPSVFNAMAAGISAAYTGTPVMKALKDIDSQINALIARGGTQ